MPPSSWSISSRHSLWLPLRYIPSPSSFCLYTWANHLILWEPNNLHLKVTSPCTKSNIECRPAPNFSIYRRFLAARIHPVPSTVFISLLQRICDLPVHRLLFRESHLLSPIIALHLSPAFLTLCTAYIHLSLAIIVVPFIMYFLCHMFTLVYYCFSDMPTMVLHMLLCVLPNYLHLSSLRLAEHIF